MRGISYHLSSITSQPLVEGTGKVLQMESYYGNIFNGEVVNNKSLSILCQRQGNNVLDIRLPCELFHRNSLVVNNPWVGPSTNE